MRIIKRDLVYIVGLSEKDAKKEKLLGNLYFGQYGEITKIIVNDDRPFNKNVYEQPSYSAYITYKDEKEASIAILVI